MKSVKRGIMVVLGVVLIALFIGSPVSVTDGRGAWGVPRFLVNAPLAESPAVMTHEGITWLAWTAPDETEQRHYASIIAGNVALSPKILAMPALNPLAYRLFPAEEGRAHWLWLESDATRILRLYVALVNTDLIAELAPTALSRRATRHYSAVSLPEGRVRVVWSEGNLGGETLYTSVIDGRGRVTFPVALGVNGTQSALVALDDGRVVLYWQEESTLLRAILEGDSLTQHTVLGNTPFLSSQEALIGFSASHDRAHGYVFWQGIGADGSPFVYWTHGTQTQSSWQPPRLLTFTATTHPYEAGVGFNVGTLHRAGMGNTALIGWGMPLVGEYEVVPLVGTVNNQLVVLFIRDGEPIAWQPIAENIRLLSTPSLATDRTRHLQLAWSQAYDTTQARLMWHTTQR